LLYKFSHNTDKIDPGAAELAKELDGLPLALSTAGAYLEHVSMTLSEYLQLYKASWLELQTMSPQLDSYEERSLYSTWQITFDRIRQQNPASASMLKLWAYFDRQDIWFELLQYANARGDRYLQELTKDKVHFHNALALLCSFGLVEPDRALQQQCGSGGYSVHSCVHSWMFFVLNKEWDQSLAQFALTCVASEIPMKSERNSWILQRRLLQHAIRQDQFLLEGKVDPKGIEWTLDMLGLLWSDQGKLAEAEAMYLRALEGKEKALGPDHTSTLETVNNLGNLYSDQGKLAEAEAMYLRALEGKEKALGPDHTSTLETVNNLGTLYRDQGKLAEAEAMYLRALEGKEKALGPDHISTLETVNNLGNLYRDQGKLAEAEAIYLRALEGSEKALGPDHTSTLSTVNNLGNLYSDQGKLAEAEAIYLRALEGREKALGPDHTSTLETVNNLGTLYSDQGKLAEAEAMYVRALQGYEEALGLELASSYLPALITMFGLGDLFSQTDRKDIARAIYIRALSGYAIAQGPSSKRCKQLEDRLQALQVVSAESKVGQNEFTEPEAAKSRSFKQKLRKLGRRLNT
jgi:tetratricopeptide (TPR) repeat protein